MVYYNELSEECRKVYPNGVNPMVKGKKTVIVNGIEILADFKDGNVTVDRLLDNVDLSLDWYVPSKFAIEFMIFIRLVLGENPENSNPKAHYFFVDCVFQQANVEPFFIVRGIPYMELRDRIVILASREFSKSTLMTYIFLWMAVKGSIPGFGRVNYIIYCSDSIRNGVDTMMKTIKSVYNESEYLRDQFEDVRLTQVEVNFIRKPVTKGEKEAYHKTVVVEGLKPEQVPGRMKRTFTLTGIGANALPLNSILYTNDGITTIGNVKVGDMIFGDDGKLAKVTEKSIVFNKPIWKIVLTDGRELSVSSDHINNIYTKKKGKKDDGSHIVKYVEHNWTTTELLEKEIKRVYSNGKLRHMLFIKNIEPLEYSDKEFDIDPYTIGVLLGDGHMSSKGSTRVEGLEDDIEIIVQHSKWHTIRIHKVKQRVGRRKTTRASFIDIADSLENIGLRGCIGSNKRIPKEYLYGSIDQRLELLRGLIDTDGQIKKSGLCRFDNISYGLVTDVQYLVRSLGGYANKITTQDRRKYGWSDVYSVSFRLMLRCPTYIPRKAARYNCNGYSGYVAIDRIESVAKVPSQCIAISNSSRLYVAGDKDGSFMITHNTGGRGSRDALARPDGVVFDDILPSEKDANSDTILASAESTIESDLLPGMNNNKNFSILIGTPYSKKDSVYKRVELGTWLPIVFPRGNELPMNKDTFVSVWPDRHSYTNCRRDYTRALKSKEAGDSSVLRKLLQEHYLRISSEDERMIPDSMLQWYSRKSLGKYLEGYKLYMTTDFTASNTIDSGDYSVIAMWACTNNKDWFMLDLVCRRMTIQQQFTECVNMVQKWSVSSGQHITVGVEIDGQQQTNIYSLQELQRKHQVWFSFASQIGQSADKFGISRRRSGNDKHGNFMQIQHLFFERKIFFPEELAESPDMLELMDELKYITYTSINSKHDDALDVISMLGLINVIYPNVDVVTHKVIGTVDSNWNVYKSRDDFMEDDYEDAGWASYV